MHFNTVLSAVQWETLEPTDRRASHFLRTRRGPERPAFLAIDEGTYVDGRWVPDAG
jgi:hypothetical protein